MTFRTWDYLPKTVTSSCYVFSPVVFLQLETGWGSPRDRAVGSVLPSCAAALALCPHGFSPHITLQ